MPGVVDDLHADRVVTGRQRRERRHHHRSVDHRLPGEGDQEAGVVRRDRDVLVIGAGATLLMRRR